MKSSSSDDVLGFSLLELMAILAITGILAGIAAPSLLSEKKDLKAVVIPMETVIKTVNLSARANSGNPYRITLGTKQQSQYLKVESFQNGSCDPSTPSQIWRHDVRKDLMLPPDIQISNFPTVNVATGQNGICFNGRGEVYGGEKQFTVTDLENRRTKVKAVIRVSAVGDVSRITYTQSGVSDPSGKLD